MRILGAILILSGCFGLGIWYRERILGRIKALRQLQNLLIHLVSEIDYHREPLPEACGMIGRRFQNELGQALQSTAIRMRENKGESFEKVFRSEIRAVLEKMPIKEEDRSDFFLFLSETGHSDESIQIKLLRDSCNILKEKTDLLYREKNEKCRMAIGLGILSGCMLVLVLC